MVEAAEMRKRGLVLEGGGAKGAYAFAFIRQLHEAGAHFDVVAGTSVGALNALIWATEQFEPATELWETISLKRVYPFRLPRPLSYSLFPLIFMFHCYRRFNQGLPPLHEERESFGNSVLRMAFMVLNEFPLLLFSGAIAFGSEVPVWGRMIGLVFVIGLIWGPLDIVYSQVDSAGIENFLRGSIFGFYFFAGALLAIFGVLVGLAVAPIKTFFGLVGCLGLWFLYRRLSRRSPSILRNISILSPTPLRNHITQFAEHLLRINCYVAAAIPREMFDPADPTYFPIIRGPDEPPIWIAGTKTMYIPKYLQLNHMNREDIIRTCLASAALPFGIVPSVNLNGEEYVDGGLADNLPWHPLVREEHCEQLVVIRLSPEADDGTRDAYLQEWRRIERLQKLVDIEPPTDELRRPELPQKYERHVSIALPERWPEIITHRPKRSLGGLLNFSRSHMRELMKWGEEDAREFLSQNSQLLSIGTAPSLPLDSLS